MKHLPLTSSSLSLSFTEKESPSFFTVMRNRLIMWSVAISTTLLLSGAGSATAAAAVIDFNSAEDLAKFNQQSDTSFWSHSPTAGVNSSGGLVGVNTKTAGWAVMTQGFAANTPSVSGGIYFKLAEPDATASGYSIFFGVAPVNTYAGSVVSVTGDTGKNHYGGAIQYNKPDEQNPTRKYRVSTQTMVDGTVATDVSDYVPLSADAWYFLSLESTFNAVTSRYTLTMTLYASDGAGVLGQSILSSSIDDFEIAGLSSATENYLFFGMDGRAATRGIAGVDNLTYDVELIPEPSSVALLGAALAVGAVAIRRWSKAKR